MKSIADYQKIFEENAKKAEKTDEASDLAVDDGSQYVNESNNHLLRAKSTKSNVLTRAYYRFSLNEKRVMESMISRLDSMQAYKEGDKPLIVAIELSADAFATTFGLSSKNAYGQLQAAVSSLIRKIITVRKSSDNYIEYTLMIEAEYSEGEGFVKAIFNPRILPHLLGLKNNFTSYPLLTAVNFSSSYTWRFYELLVSWAKPKSKEVDLLVGWIYKIEIDDLRRQLGVPDSYKTDAFLRRVMVKAKEELLIDAGIEMNYKLIKKGRKYMFMDIEFMEIAPDQLKLEI